MYIYDQNIFYKLNESTFCHQFYYKSFLTTKIYYNSFKLNKVPLNTLLHILL